MSSLIHVQLLEIVFLLYSFIYKLSRVLQTLKNCFSQILSKTLNLKAHPVYARKASTFNPW